MVFLELLYVINTNLLFRLNDNDIVKLFGDHKLPHESNLMLAKMAQTFIIDSN